MPMEVHDLQDVEAAMMERLHDDGDVACLLGCDAFPMDVVDDEEKSMKRSLEMPPRELACESEICESTWSRG